MNGPQVVCAGCGAATSIHAPLCTDCARNYVELVGEIPVCALCNSSLYGEPKIRAADKFGIHYTMTGGYAGKCSAADTVTHRGEVMNPPASAAQGAEARNLNTPQRHGSGAEPQGSEAQAMQHSAAPNLCEDCPPIGYPTDKTRCLPCPRRADDSTEDQKSPSGPTATNMDARESGHSVAGAGRQDKL